MAQQLPQLQTRMTAADWIDYNERAISFGEENAARWVRDKYGEP